MDRDEIEEIHNRILSRNPAFEKEFMTWKDEFRRLGKSPVFASQPEDCSTLASIAIVAEQHADMAHALGAGYEAHEAYYHGISTAYAVALTHCIDAIKTL